MNYTWILPKEKFDNLVDWKIIKSNIFCLIKQTTLQYGASTYNTLLKLHLCLMWDL
jgi:hypothetical protein